MKVLIVCSGNVDNFDFKLHHAFIYEQIEAIKEKYDIDYDTFFIKGKGVFGYLKNLKSLMNKLKVGKFDIVHAHFGLSGLLANLQTLVPVVITLHGSDINNKRTKIFSLIARILARVTIFVSPQMTRGLKITNSDYIIPCGINLSTFYPINMYESRKKTELSLEKKYILFASNFDNYVKNSPLAKTSLKISKINAELLELKNKSRYEVNLLLNSVDLLILTSLSEGSPQIIKEAMACNCPIVATDVGDIREIIKDTKGCYTTSFDSTDIADKIMLAFKYGQRTNGREQIKHLDNTLIAKKIIEVYKTVIGKDPL